MCCVTPSLSNLCQKIISFNFFDMGLTSLPPVWTMSTNKLVFFYGTPVINLLRVACFPLVQTVGDQTKTFNRDITFRSKLDKLPSSYSFAIYCFLNFVSFCLYYPISLLVVLARSPDGPQRIRVASVFELSVLCLFDCLFSVCLWANFLILLLILLFYSSVSCVIGPLPRRSTGD